MTLALLHGTMWPQCYMRGSARSKGAEAALEKIAKGREVDAADLEASDPELWIYDPTLLGGPGPQVPTLVWRTEVTPDGFVDFNELVLV